LDFPQTFWNNHKSPEIIAEGPLKEAELKNVFVPGRNSDSIPTGNDWNYGSCYIGVKLKWYLHTNQDDRFINIGEQNGRYQPLISLKTAGNLLSRLTENITNPFHSKSFKRIYAERNIIPETDSNTFDVDGHGNNATRIIQGFINLQEQPHEFVQVHLLNDLNQILQPDAKFINITSQRWGNGSWEVFLDQENGRVPLSQQGSGLKTIILVLVYIHLVPEVEKKDLSDYVFGFEELENNLHPALLRRLLSYLSKKATEQGCTIFLTTHSNIEIDMFSKHQDAQILHVTRDGKQAKCKSVKTYVENKGILDDLDIRASDILQSNGVIWVEGPSDRIYLNRWIEQWSDGQLSEGTHYQCVFYGGRLLSHLSSDEPELAKDSVSILNVNSNAIVIIDSDKRTEADDINDTKSRIVEEVTKNNGTAWVTIGKEIENYIPAKAVEKLLGLDQTPQQVELYENFFDYLDSMEEGKGKHYEKKKPLLAERVIPHLSKDNIAETFDLSSRLDAICAAIRTWNSMD